MKKRGQRPTKKIPSLIDKVDLAAAMQPSLTANDLLPPREDDDVAGQLGKRFTEHLKRRLSSGSYSPEPAEFVRVPKPGFTSRPAAALSLIDRIVYEALVAGLRPALSRYLVPDNIVLWPRESPTRRRWKEFEHAPAEANTKYVVRADISGFYESIDHAHLEDDLLLSTGDPEIVDELIRFLSTAMRTHRGVPQGLMASDTLATTFLQRVDAAMVREGLAYWRHGDDVRVAVNSMSSAREAIALFEEELRNRGLLVNSAKCSIEPGDVYTRQLRATEATFEKTHKLLLQDRITRLSRNPDALGQAMKDAQLDSQLAWDLFYHARISVDVVIEKLREHIEPSDVEVAERLFEEALSAQPSSPDALPRDVFHHQIVSSLIRLAAGRSAVALCHSASLIARFPEKTEIACQYLHSMAESHAEDVVAQIENVLTSDVYATSWQKAWLLRTLAPLASLASSDMVDQLVEMARSDSVNWIVRVEAMKALAWRGDLTRELGTLAWKTVPSSYRSDVLAAICMMSGSEDWARSFVSVTQLDPIEKAVVERVRNRA